MPLTTVRLILTTAFRGSCQHLDSIGKASRAQRVKQGWIGAGSHAPQQHRAGPGLNPHWPDPTRPHVTRLTEHQAQDSDTALSLSFATSQLGGPGKPFNSQASRKLSETACATSHENTQTKTLNRAQGQHALWSAEMSTRPRNKP